ncbi:MAG TPA: M23 family metallopeptidase, partial [archaeon]|nr:M23 family metallopeptidase [archaeon]
LTAFLFCFTLLLGIGYLTLSSCNKNLDYLKFINLQRENRILTQKLETVEQKISSLNGTINDLMKENQAFRTIAGLEVLDDEIKKVGIGGTFSGNYDELFEINSQLARKIYTQEDQVDELQRKADLVTQSLQEAIQSMEESADKWAHFPSIMPSDGYISSRFGRRSHPIFHILQQHNGIDISCRHGASIIAPADGTVKMVKHQIGYGLTVMIDHNYGIVTKYAHCSKSNVRVGQKIKRGDIIAFVGKTGITTGPNLHYEVVINGTAKNPESYILDNYIP